MSLQDDVNDQVAGIISGMAAAGAVELPAAQTATVTIDFQPVRDALIAVADALDALSGDSSGVRAAILGIENQEQEVEISFGDQNTAIAAHLAAGNGMVSLLITGSNFDGQNQ
jgi:hypothetical protein